MQYKGFCPELGKEHIVTRDILEATPLSATNYSKENQVKGLLDCRYAQYCKYLKENKRCALEK